MADIIIAVVAKIAEYLVKPVIREGKYFLCVNKVIKDLQNEKKELASEKDNLQIRIERVEGKGEIIEEPIEKWSKDAGKLLEEVADLEQKMTTNTRCLYGWCPTWRRYRLCKQMVKKIQAIGEFKGKSNIQPFSHSAPLMGIQYHSSKNFTYFESTKVADDQLLEALKDDAIYMIGVYGIGGSGKTTLVTEVGKKVDKLNWFDKVISISVSQIPNLKGIQGEMADKLEVELKEVSEEMRAQRLWSILKKKRRILIIVDDLWSMFDLKKIGIRLENDNKGRWKVLITTRDEHVCDLMDCQKKIHLKLLSEEESWILFQKHANISDGFSKSLDDIPQKLCNECKGLPIAVVTVGSSLKGKPKADWNVALDSLRHSEAIDDDHVDEGVRDTFSCLELSFGHLPNKEAKLLFLMCSMFPEDYSISIEDLIRYAIGVGLGGTFSLDSTRNNIRANINKLLQCCLLMHASDNKNSVKMHDVVRDAALWIARRLENRQILVSHDKTLNALTEGDTIRDCFAVSSWYNENQSWKNDAQWHAPKLEILLLNTRIWDGSLDLSDATLEGIHGLKVFAAINGGGYPLLLSLPQSLRWLTNLRTLRLHCWKLRDISVIVSLTSIVVLDLQYCDIDEIPNEIGKLKRLKLLDLSQCCIHKNYNGEIGKCLQLEEFYSSQPFGANLGYHHQSIRDIITLPKLQRFIINTTFMSGPLHYAEKKRVFAVRDLNISNLRESKKNILQIVDCVHFERLHGGCENFIPDMVSVFGGMNNLTTFSLYDCQEIECLFHTSSDSEVGALIPKLAELYLTQMQNLKELFHGPPLQVLCFLEKLEIINCKQLQSIFPWKCELGNLRILTIVGTPIEVLFSKSVAQSLEKLEQLRIESCYKLKHIIASDGENGSNASGEIVQAPRTSHFVMPRLKEVYIYQCVLLGSIFQICCVQDQIELPCLEVLKLNALESLVRICPENCGAKWPSLKKVYVQYCPKLTTSWIGMMVDSEYSQQNLDEQKHLPSTLQQLELINLSQLNFIPWVLTPGKILGLQCLQYLEVGDCENLKFMFSVEAHRSLPELISLKIYYCQELEQIIAPNEELVQLPDAETYFPKLTDITVTNCNKLKSLFPVAMVRMLPQLSTLYIYGCTQLREVFRHCNRDTINEMEIVLPNLIEIELYELPSFVDICQYGKLKAMKLQELNVYECPKSTTSLRAIQYFTYMGMPAVEGPADKMETFLSQNINTMDIQLLLAASKGDKSEIEHLLRNGAKYDVEDVDGRTALDRANDEIKDFILVISKQIA